MQIVQQVGLFIGTLFTLFVQPASYAILVDVGMTLGGAESNESEASSHEADEP